DLFGARFVAHSPWSHLHQIVTQQLTRLTPDTNASQAKSELIDLHVEVVPATARLLLDGREASNPLKISYPADGKTHELRCSADGFKTRVQQVRFDRSVSVLIGLVPLPSAGSGLRDNGSVGAVQVGVRD
ncbi:MAG TPA: hypothetical protein VKP30_14235, partial [Polyangiaceae bacterium]|nr:hypothetical protein [Polyangiaceae bacterium]